MFEIVLFCIYTALLMLYKIEDFGARIILFTIALLSIPFSSAVLLPRWIDQAQKTVEYTTNAVMFDSLRVRSNKVVHVQTEYRESYSKLKSPKIRVTVWEVGTPEQASPSMIIESE